MYDKNAATVKIKDGSMTVNGRLMQVTTVLGVTRYTMGEELRVVPDSTYTFAIVLSDQREYGATVRTRLQDLNLLTVPAVQSRTQELRVSWRERGSDYSMTLEVAYITRSASGADSTAGKQTFGILNPGTTENYTLAASNFVPYPGAYRLHVTLTAESVGTIDPRFRSGRAIRTRFSIEQDVTFQ